MPFDAFISYSHAADGALAPAVQRGLQTLARPWNRRRALEVFRDQTGLAVSPGLWTSICQGLDDSRYFVLLASPEAAQSTWVNQEIVHWTESHSVDQLLPVVTAGEWEWDSSTGDFDWDTSTAVPQALTGRFREEPHYLDLRWARTETELDLRHSKFREAITQLAAPMHGVSPEDLESNDVARFRHLVRLRRAVVAVLCTLLVLVSVAGVLAVQKSKEAQRQQHEAQAQQARAEQQARRALSLQLLAQAKVIANQHKTLSLLLTAEAARLAPTEAWGSLVTGLTDAPGLTKVFDLPVRRQAGIPTAVDVEAKIYATAPPHGIQPQIRLWSLDSGQRSGPVDSDTGERPPLIDSDFYGFALTELKFSPRGTLAATYRCLSSLCATAKGAGPSSRRALGGIEVVNVATGKGHVLPDSATFSNLTFSNRGDRLAATGRDGKIRVWDVPTRTITATLSSPSAGNPTALAFSADDTMLALSEKTDGHVLVWDLTSPSSSEPVDIAFPPGDYPQGIAFGSAILVSRDNNGKVRLWRAESGKPAGLLETGDTGVADLAISADGTLATADTDGSLRLWDVDRREQVGSTRASGRRHIGAQVMFDSEGSLVSIGSDIKYWDTPRWGQVGEELYRQGAVTALTVSSDGVVASGDERGVIRLWDLGSGGPWRRPLRTQTGAVTALAFSSEGTLASGSEEGAVRLWDISTGDAVQDPNNHDGEVASLAFSPDGSTLAAGYSKARGRPIIIWSVGTGSVIERLDVGQGGDVASVAFGPGKVFASAGAESLAFWDVNAWQSKIPPESSRGGPYTAVAFTKDGKTLASSTERFGPHDDRTVALWRVPSGRPLGAPLDSGKTRGKTTPFSSLAFGADGRLLAGAGAGGVQLWDILLHQPLGGRLGSSPAVAIAVSPDGRQVISGDAAGAVQSYPATIDGWLSSVCAVVSRNLTQSEWNFYVGSAKRYDRTCRQYSAG